MSRDNIKTRKKDKKQLETLRLFLEELEWSVTKKYVEHLRGRGDLLQIGKVDVDLPQIVRRRFICDARRCIQWSSTKALVDRSCCCRYGVPVTARDRELVHKYLDLVRLNLPDDHRLRDPKADPFEPDEDYGFDMVNDNPLGGCQFNLYENGQGRCAIHKTALEHGENPCHWKPVACSLWPLAINQYDDGGPERFLLTIYCDDTDELFDAIDEDDFACIEDQSPKYPHLYQSERQSLEFLFGERWWKELDQAARKINKDGKKKKKK